MKDIAKLRELFPVTRNKVFLNHAASSALPKPVADGIRRCVDSISDFGPDSKEFEDLGKSSFARLVNAQPDEVALVENTSLGLNIAANVIHAARGSKIVTTDLEYPSVTYPFLRKSLGLEVHYVRNVSGKIPLEDIEKAVDDKTAAVAISQVEYVNGFRHDVKAISEVAHQHGAYMIVDGIQSAGAISVDVKKDDVDFLSTACYKWLLSPPGAAFLYVKKKLVDTFEPPFVGWASVKQEVFNTTDFWDIWNPQYPNTASRFEIGSPSILSFVGAREAIKLLLDVGIESVETRILMLTDYLIDLLQNQGFELQTPTEKECRSGIVNFKMRNPKAMADTLKDRNIVVSARSKGIRVSPHFYNTEEEIDKLLEEVKKSET